MFIRIFLPVIITAIVIVLAIMIYRKAKLWAVKSDLNEAKELRQISTEFNSISSGETADTVTQITQDGLSLRSASNAVNEQIKKL